MDKSRSLDDKFLSDHYCKKCGEHQSSHDDNFCESSKYPALKTEFEYLFKIADLYSFDLSDANSKQADGGRHGAIEGDICLDAISLIHQYTVQSSPLMNKKDMLSMSLSDFVSKELSNWAYEKYEILKVLKKIKEAVSNE